MWPGSGPTSLSGEPIDEVSNRELFARQFLVLGHEDPNTSGAARMNRGNAETPLALKLDEQDVPVHPAKVELEARVEPLLERLGGPSEITILWLQSILSPTCVG